MSEDATGVGRFCLGTRASHLFGSLARCLPLFGLLLQVTLPGDTKPGLFKEFATSLEKYVLRGRAVRSASRDLSSKAVRLFWESPCSYGSAYS